MGLKVRQIEKLKYIFRFAAVRFSVYVKIDVEFVKTVFTNFFELLYFSWYLYSEQL